MARKPYWMTSDHPDWPVLNCPADEDMCRHEMAAETDIRTILARYGPVGAFALAPQFGVQDFDTDSTSSLLFLRDAHEAYLASEAFRGRWPTWDEAQAALAAGSLVFEDGQLFAVESGAPQSGAPEAAAGQAEGASGSSVT